jgi:hypothetical protein
MFVVLIVLFIVALLFMPDFRQFLLYLFQTPTPTITPTHLETDTASPTPTFTSTATSTAVPPTPTATLTFTENPSPTVAPITLTATAGAEVATQMESNVAQTPTLIIPSQTLTWEAFFTAQTATAFAKTSTSTP